MFYLPCLSLPLLGGWATLAGELLNSSYGIILLLGIGTNCWIAGGAASFHGILFANFGAMGYFNPGAAIIQVNGYQAYPDLLDTIVAYGRPEKKEAASIWMDSVHVTNTGLDSGVVSSISIASDPSADDGNISGSDGKRLLLQPSERNDRSENNTIKAISPLPSQGLDEVALVRVDGEVDTCQLCDISPGGLALRPSHLPTGSFDVVVQSPW